MTLLSEITKISEESKKFNISFPYGPYGQFGDCDWPICVFCWKECIMDYVNDTKEDHKKMDCFDSYYCRNCCYYFKTQYKDDSYFYFKTLFLEITYKNITIVNPIIPLNHDVHKYDLKSKVGYKWSLMTPEE